MNPPAIRAHLALGGNIGDVAAAFIATLQTLASQTGVRLVRASSIYRTKPWGVADQPDFLNMALAIDTVLPPNALLDLCLSIEREQGRLRDQRWGPRNLDIDIITYGDEVIDEPDLAIPHPRATQRAFVVVPLAEIAGEVKIGVRPVRDLAAGIDSSGVMLDVTATKRLRASGF